MSCVMSIQIRQNDKRKNDIHTHIAQVGVIYFRNNFFLYSIVEKKSFENLFNLDSGSIMGHHHHNDDDDDDIIETTTKRSNNK